MRRAEKAIAHRMVTGERILDFDIGATPSGARATCVATTRAVFLISDRREIRRVGYDEILGTSGTAGHLELSTSSGDIVVVWDRGARGLTDVVVDGYRKVARGRRRYVATWGQGQSMTVLVAPTPSGWKVLRWTLKDGVEHSLPTSITTERAIRELEIALGSKPSFPDDTPSGVNWEPALPTEPE